MNVCRRDGRSYRLVGVLLSRENTEFELGLGPVAACRGEDKQLWGKAEKNFCRNSNK